MRLFGLLAFGILLLVVEGAVCKSWHIEWMKPDPGLVLTVFVAFALSETQGLWLVTGLGYVADSFGGTPLGIYAMSYLLIWLGCRLLSATMLADQRFARYRLLFGASVLSSLLQIGLLQLSEASSGAALVTIKVMFPLAVVNVLLAGPIWMVAQKIVKDSVQDSNLGIS